MSFGAGYGTNILLSSSCFYLTVGAGSAGCVALGVVGSIVVGWVVQDSSEYFFTKVLTKSNIEKWKYIITHSVTPDQKREYQFVLDFCTALGGGISCGSNPF